MHYLIYLKRFFQTPESLTGSFVCHFVQFYYEDFLSKYEKQDFSYSIKFIIHSMWKPDPDDFSKIILALATCSYLANAVIHMN